MKHNMQKYFPTFSYSIKILFLIFSLISFLCLVIPEHFIGAADKPCYRIDRAAAAKAKAKKKATLKANGIPKKYLQLIDRLPDCVGCIKYAPDTIHIQIVEKNDNWISFEWNPTSEYIARKDLRNGKIKAFYVIHSAKACSCCDQPEYNQRSDWDSDLEINKDLAIRYTDPKKLGPEPKYVRELPPDIGLKQIKVPDIKLPKPPRHAQPLCDACRKNANNINTASNLIYELEKKVRRLKIDRSVYKQIHKNQELIIRYSRTHPLPSDMLIDASSLSHRSREKFIELGKELKKTKEMFKLAYKNRENELSKAKKCEEKLCSNAIDSLETSKGKSPLLIYANDFEGKVGPEWSNPSTGVTSTGRKYLGKFGNQNVSLTLNNFITHTAISVSFDLFLMDSWDGNKSEMGPDIWELNTGSGKTILHTTFSNLDEYGWRQSYPKKFPGGNYPPHTGAAEVNSLGPGYYGNSVYRLHFNFAHFKSTLVLNFTASGLQGIGDESWGIDNIEVKAH